MPVCLKNITAEFTTSKLVKGKPLGDCSKLKMKTQLEEYGIYNQKNLIKECMFQDVYKSNTAFAKTYRIMYKWLLHSQTSKLYYYILHTLPSCKNGRPVCSVRILLLQLNNTRSQKRAYLYYQQKALSKLTEGNSNLYKYISGFDWKAYYILVQITDKSLMFNCSEAVYIRSGEKWFSKMNEESVYK